MALDAVKTAPHYGGFLSKHMLVLDVFYFIVVWPYPWGTDRFFGWIVWFYGLSND